MSGTSWPRARRQARWGSGNRKPSAFEPRRVHSRARGQTPRAVRHSTGGEVEEEHEEEEEEEKVVVVEKEKEEGGVELSYLSPRFSAP
ncbi:hypothetical protein KOW79_006039 [Hemibagrus wyckioides]|uniref:Uncharacterized protein n=1 Tax=Hemibagrus wyckioides TaxID=337641 RepID=A0A9D3NWN8_9TELE|nr:hypothetical protein KOW79_006039 [Hemibagrus wyckioides]